MQTPNRIRIYKEYTDRQKDTQTDRHVDTHIYTSWLRPLLAPLANPRAFVTILDNTRFVLEILNKSGGGCLGLYRDMLLHNIRSNLGQKKIFY